LEDIERQLWLIENMLLMPKHEAWVSRDIRIERASGTTRIEGAGMDPDAVRALARNRPAGQLTEDQRSISMLLRRTSSSTSSATRRTSHWTNWWSASSIATSCAGWQSF
jgi:hypothetical protein